MGAVLSQLSDLGGARLAASFGALSVDHIEYTGEDGVAAIADSRTVATLLPGLPVGVQFAAGFGREDVLIRLASQLEEAQPWTGRHPPVQQLR